MHRKALLFCGRHIMLCVRILRCIASLAGSLLLAAPALAHGGHCGGGGGGGGHCGGHSFGHSCGFSHSHSFSCHTSSHGLSSHMASYAGWHSLAPTYSSLNGTRSQSCTNNTEHIHVGFFRRLFMHSHASPIIAPGHDAVVGASCRPTHVTCFVRPQMLQANRISSLTAFMTTESTVSAATLINALKTQASDFDVMEYTDLNDGDSTNAQTEPATQMNLEIVPVRRPSEDQDEEQSN